MRMLNLANASGCEIGDGSEVGSFVELQKNVRIGKRCKISSHAFICDGVEIEDDVLVSHNGSFINDELSLPIHPELSDEQVAYVAESVNSLPNW